MAAHRAQHPVPADLIDDLEIALQFVEALPLPDLSTPEKRQAYQPVSNALRGLRGTIDNIRAHRAENPLSVPVELMNKAYLETLQRMLRNLSGGTPEERRAIERVSRWLNGN